MRTLFQMLLTGCTVIALTQNVAAGTCLDVLASSNSTSRSTKTSIEAAHTEGDSLIDFSIGIEPAPQVLTESVLSNPSHPNYRWLSSVAARVIRPNVSAGSATIVGLNSLGMGVMYSAHHVFNPWPSSDDATQPETIGFEQNRSHRFWAYYNVAQGENRAPMAHLYWPNVGYTLYRPAIKHGELNVNGENYQDRFANFPSTSDFIIGALTDKQAPENAIVDQHQTDPIQRIPDPYGLMSRQPIAAPVVGEPALLIGFPSINNHNQSYSIGEILSAEEAVAFHQKLIAESDSKVTFDPRANFIVMAKATPGMSGGGVFDKFGRFLGVLVRGGESLDGTPYAWALRADWIRWQVNQAIDRMPPDEREDARSLISISN